MSKSLIHLNLMLVLLCACTSDPVRNANGKFAARNLAFNVNTVPVVSLYRARDLNSEKPQLLNVELLPGMGMHVYQIRAYVPGKGILDLLSAPPIESSKDRLDEKLSDTKGGSGIPLVGGSISVGLTSDKNSGLTAYQKVDQLSLLATAEGAFAQATLLTAEQKPKGKLQLGYSAALKGDILALTVVAKNIGTESLPMSLGWCPRIQLGSFDLSQLRFRAQAQSQVEYSSKTHEPTGRLLALKESDVDFSARGGAELGDSNLRVDLSELFHDRSGATTFDLIDPVSQLQLRMKTFSNDVQSLKIDYRPKERTLALCPQFQLPFPQAKVWQREHAPISYKNLKPSEIATFTVELEIMAYHGS